MFSIFNLKKTKYISIFLLITLFTLGIFFLTQSTQAKPSSKATREGVFNPKFDWFYLRTSNDITVYMGKMFSKLPTIRYEKGKDHLQFSMTGISYSNLQPISSRLLHIPSLFNLQPKTYHLQPISSTTAVTLETNVKTPNEPVLFYRGVDKDIDVIYRISNIPLKVKEEIVLKKVLGVSELGFREDNENLTPTTYNLQPITFLFSAETTATPVKQSDGSIAFFDNDNKYLFQLDKPFMIDANLNRSEAVTIEIKPVRHRVSNTFKRLLNLQLYTFSPQSFLNNFIINKFFKSPYRHPMSVRAVTDPQQYTITLKADSDWLSTAVYPVIIDPTITHNADANFTGQMNRITDNDSTSSTQLESSYPEATKDPHTVLLLHFNEANGTTAGIRDYASTTRVITANGNASTTSYVTQLGLGNSAAFDGTSDYFEISDSDDWDFAASSTDTTISMWVYANDILYTRLIGQSNAGADGNWSLGISQSDNNGDIYLGTAGGPVLSSGNGAIIAGRWYNIAIAKRNGFTEMYKDGLLVASGSAAYFNAATTFLRIGARAAADGDFNGYIDNIRILKGRALTPEEIKAAASRRPYAVYTSPVLDATASVQWDTLNWTEGGVNTGNGEQPYSTNSLVAQWDFNDTSGTTLTASSSGSCTTACNGTLTNFAYTASQDQATTTTGWTANNKKWGAGALMFDGSNDYVSVGDSDNWNFGSGNFTIETWMNFSVLQNTHFFNQYADGSNYWKIYFNNDTKKLNFGALTSASDVVDVNAPWSPNTNTWYHIALVRSGSTESANDWNLFVNGKALTLTKASGLWAGSWGDYAGGINIGRWGGGGYLFNGIIDSLRIYKGRALSASEILSNYNAGNIEIQTRSGATSDPNDGTWEAWKPITGETQLLSMDSDAGNWNAPQQIDGYTKLLLHMDGTDTATTFPNSATTTHTVTRSGDAQVDTAQSKFGGGSALFDGTGDYLSVADSEDWAFGSGDFTIETWVNFSAISGKHGILGQYVDATHYWFLRANFTDCDGIGLDDYNGAMTVSLFQGSCNGWSANTWYHIALVRNGSSFNIYRNGLSIASATDSDSLTDYAASLTAGLVRTADYLNGWMDELRVSKGIARWASNFTPPPRAYGSNVKASSEDVIKMEGASSTKFMIGAPQIDGNTVALWHFEETGTTTGTYLFDETANNNDATTTGTTVVDGIFGKARSFNGTSDYVSAADSDDWDFGTGDFTVSLWVRFSDFPSAAGGNRASFINHGNTGHTVDVDGWAIFYDNSNNRLYFRAKNGASNLDGFKSWSPSPGQWYFVTVVRSSNNIFWYVDANQLESPTSISVDISAGASQLRIGSNHEGGYLFNGIIDEPRILKGRALSADEIAETYRMGANHHLTRQVSAVDLSAQTKLAFNVAADRPGTYLEAMLGESDYANYELASSTLALSTTTVLYIKGDEIASSTSIKDSSFSGKAITANGNARTAGNGKIGNSVYFDGTGDYLSIPNSEDFNFGSGDFSVDFWVNFSSIIADEPLIGNWTYAAGVGPGWIIQLNGNGSNVLDFRYGISTGGYTAYNWAWVPTVNTWYHIAIVRTGSTLKFFLNGVAQDSGGSFSAGITNSSLSLMMGYDTWNTTYFPGNLDELRIIKGTALTPDQIRQAYEYGLRSHQITIDFGATLQSSDLISNSTDYNFNITATTSGLSATTSGLYLGDKIIIKENLGGTEYSAQGTVNAINTTTGAITVPSWDTGSTFPSGNGYSPNATVFKWQREYFDLAGAATTTRNAITNLTLRPINGAEGRTIYLDDFRYNTNYLTASSSSTITSSNNRYLQYRAIFTSTDSFVSPFLSAFNTLYTSLVDMFPAGVGISGDGFLIF